MKNGGLKIIFLGGVLVLAFSLLLLMGSSMWEIFSWSIQEDQSTPEISSESRNTQSTVQPVSPSLKIENVKFFDLGDGVGTLEFSVESNLPTADNLEVMVYKNTLVSGGLKTCRYSYLSGQSRSVEYFKNPQSFDLVDKNPLTTCMTIDNGTLNSNAKDAGADWVTEDGGGSSDGQWVDYDTKTTKALHPLLKINVRHTGSDTKAIELFPLKKAKKYY